MLTDEAAIIDQVIRRGLDTVDVEDPWIGRLIRDLQWGWISHVQGPLDEILREVKSV